MNRLESATARMRDHGLAGLLVTTPANAYYLSRFPTETCALPVVVVVSENPVLVVPELEEARARDTSVIGDILTYSDRQYGRQRGFTHLHLALAVALEALKELGTSGPIGLESEGLSAEGFFTLRSRIPAQVVPTRGIVEEMRMVKDAGEMELIRVAAGLADHGIGAGIAECRPGNTIPVIGIEATAAMVRAGAARHPELRVTAASHPAAGPNAPWPHSPAAGRALAAGDALICSAVCTVDGYHAEAERTVLIETASDDQRRLFEVILRAASAARAAIRPGVPCQEVDRAARAVVAEAGCGPQFTRMTGHGLGIGRHELPYLAEGDDTVLAPGMVVSVGPGIHVEGGDVFRHTDTILVKDDGCEVLTLHPRHLEALTTRS
ncbi:MAG: aminopeptidase P family protein [Armatimonadetes bacterium]|nr:aminopeptidase P family protein [Armatimonadota bacterium]